MLDHLPNEILQKIFHKSNFTTNGNCRLLNSRYNQIIVKDDLQKMELQKIQLTCYGGCYHLNVFYPNKYSDIWEDFKVGGKWLKQSTLWKEVVEEFLVTLEKIKSIAHFQFDGIQINKSLLDQLFNFEVFRKTKELSVSSCYLDNRGDELMNIQNALQLDSFYWFNTNWPTGYRPIHLRNMLLNQIKTNFEFIAPEDLSETFTDDLLEHWLRPEKTFNMILSTTGFTLKAIVKHIRDLRENPNWTGVDWSFGHLKGVTKANIVQAMAEFGGGLKKMEYRTSVYVITDLNQKKVHITLGSCRE